MRGWRATRPHPSRRPGPEGPNSSRSSTGPGYTRRHRPRPWPCPSSGGGRRPPPLLASASTAEKNAAPVAAADLLDQRPRPAGGEPARRRGRRRSRDGRRTARPAALTTPGSAPWPTACARCGAARPDRRGARRLAASQRPAHRAAPRALGRRDHLREPPERHQRRRRHLPEVGQRRHPAGLGHRSGRTWPSPRCSATASPRRDCPPTQCSSTTSATTPRSSSCSSPTSSTASSARWSRSSRASATTRRYRSSSTATAPATYVDATADLDNRAQHPGQRQDPAPERLQRG